MKHSSMLQCCCSSKAEAPIWKCKDISCKNSSRTTKKNSSPCCYHWGLVKLARSTWGYRGVLDKSPCRQQKQILDQFQLGSMLLDILMCHLEWFVGCCQSSPCKCDSFFHPNGLIRNYQIGIRDTINDFKSHER